MTKTNIKIISYLPQFLSSVPGLLIFLTRACHNGWSSPSTELLLSPNSTIPTTNNEAVTIVSLLAFGGFLGPIFLLLFLDRFGRKVGMFIAVITMLIGWVIIMFATTVIDLYVARIIAGFGGGVCVTIVPLYLAEITSDNIRGGICSLPQFMVILGPILEYIIVPQMKIQKSAVVSAIIPMITLALLHWIPESPYYLLIKQKEDEAEESLRNLRTCNIDEEFKNVKLCVEKSCENRTRFIHLFTKINNRNALTIVWSLVVISIGSGYYIVTSYIHIILNKIDPQLSIDNYALLISSVPLISCLIFSFLVDIVGRKILLFFSCLFSCFTTLFVAIFFHLRLLDYDVVELHTWVPVMCLAVYNFMQGMGLATIIFIYVGELFPTNIKLYASSITYCFLFLAMTGFNELYKLILNSYGIYLAFYIYAAVSLVGMIYVLMIPETMGKSFNEIEIELGTTFKKLSVVSTISKN